MKSIRGGLANINGAYARVENGQVFAYDVDVQAYAKASFAQHEPKRSRRLLLHKGEIERLFGLTQIRGNTLPVLRMYWKGARVKLEIGVGKGKGGGGQAAGFERQGGEAGVGSGGGAV